MGNGNETVPMTVNYNPSQGYSLNPKDPKIKKNGTARINGSNCDFTICFNPTNTPFGSCISMHQTDPAKDVDVGDSNYTLTYCITNYGGSCTPPGMLADDPTGTIKVGSGTGTGTGKK
ncbi:MAG TPA: hypothetical protein VGL89_19930 [Candidatus Koribacter sp.]|jgi:hypothetical protein